MVFPKTWVSRLALAIPFAMITLPVLVAPFDLGVVAWLAGCAAVYAGLCVLIGRGRLELDDAGVRRRSWTGRVTGLRWDEIRDFTYSANPRDRDRRARAFAPISAAAEARLGKGVRIAYVLTVIAGDGRRLKITSAFRNADEAIAQVLRRIQPPIVEAARARLCAGDAIELGPMLLSRSELGWRGKTAISIGEVERADLWLEGGKTLLRVLKHRKAFPYAAIDATRLCTPVAITMLREVGVEVEVPPWFEP